MQPENRPTKKFALTVARQAWTSDPPIIVAHIPWDQFEAPGGPAAYTQLIERTGSDAVIVSRFPGGAWSSTTKVGEAWKAICRETPLDSMQWQTMPIEASAYPWEMFQRP